MHEMVEFLAKHGYWLLFVSVLGRQACLPVPANLLLLAAGALAGLGRLSFVGVIVLSVTAFVVADLAWYEVGRRWGGRTLHFICGGSREPGSCVDKLAKSFSRHGVKLLMVSKFVTGLDAVAVPMSGISGIARRQFLFFDVMGAILWSLAYTTVGYVFSDQLDRLTTCSARIGTAAVLLEVVVLGVFIGVKLVRFLREFRLARITPDELEDKLATVTSS